MKKNIIQIQLVAFVLFNALTTVHQNAEAAGEKCNAVLVKTLSDKIKDIDRTEDGEYSKTLDSFLSEIRKPLFERERISLIREALSEYSSLNWRDFFDKNAPPPQTSPRQRPLRNIFTSRFFIAGAELLAIEGISNTDMQISLLHNAVAGTEFSPASLISAIDAANPGKLSARNVLHILSLTNTKERYAVSYVIKNLDDSFFKRLTDQELAEIIHLPLEADVIQQIENIRGKSAVLAVQTPMNELAPFEWSLSFSFRNRRPPAGRYLGVNLAKADKQMMPILRRLLKDNSLSETELDQLMTLPRYPMVTESLVSIMNQTIERSDWQAALSKIEQYENAGSDNELVPYSARDNRNEMAKTILRKSINRMDNDDVLSFLEVLSKKDSNFADLLLEIPTKRLVGLSAEEKTRYSNLLIKLRGKNYLSEDEFASAVSRLVKKASLWQDSLGKLLGK